MKLKINGQYKLIDHGVGQGLPGNPPLLRVQSLAEYKGQWIVVGEKLAHQQHVYRCGFQTIPARLSCGVVLPGDIPANAKALTMAFNGRPMALQEDGDATMIPLVNWAATLGALWQSHGKPRGHDELMRRATKVIDVYHEWRLTGNWPGWFVAAKRPVDSRDPERAGSGLYVPRPMSVN